MRTFAHIVNPVIASPPSDLCVAQPVTFESMRQAKRLAGACLVVRLLTAQYTEDRALVPPDFAATADLDRSVLDVGDFRLRRKLPLLRDILDRAYEATPEADYLIYTNVDIGLAPGFYLAVDRLINAGYDALVINRRTISAGYAGPDDLPMMWAEIGEPHSGHDCFVFRRDAYPRYRLDDVCVGINYVGRILIVNLAAHASRFAEFKDVHLTFHLGDERAWRRNEYADYVAHNQAATLRALRAIAAADTGLLNGPFVRPYLDRDIFRRAGFA